MARAGTAAYRRRGCCRREIFYTTADRAGAAGNLRGNAGVVVDFTPNHHLLASAGRSIRGDTRFFGYLAYQLTL